MREQKQKADALRIALEMEKRGYQLYTRALTLTQDTALIQLLEKLAEEEKGHFFLFQEMLQAESPDEPVVEDAALIGALAAEHFYKGGLMRTAMDGGLASTEAMLQAAIASEKDAIDFYESLYKDAPPTQKAILRRIIQEEHRHAIALKDWLAKEKQKP